MTIGAFHMKSKTPNFIYIIYLFILHIHFSFSFCDFVDFFRGKLMKFIIKDLKNLSFEIK